MEFEEFPKMARLSREIIVTEKIDGTNACIGITEDGKISAGSRSRWITPEDDNYGFSAWVHAHRDELLTLGPGRHFGEWWGQGIQRRYGLSEKRFSLFNVSRWALHGTTPHRIATGDPRIVKVQDVAPACCGLVPVLYSGDFDTARIDEALAWLRACGSFAAPGFMKPEGIVVFHLAGGVGFKKTIEKDDMPKSIPATRKDMVEQQ
ncbi:RNA ligase family protein [Nevskia ramosa]|uniref:RNA ligase family protein n=1 Tax=Nevskia ramosa TaxID=64002 RepID=UPI003D0F4038